MPIPASAPAGLVEAVKRLAITESRLSLRPADIADDEPLGGPLLKVSSLGFLGMLMQLEDEVGVALPDDLFVGRRFDTVADVVGIVAAAASRAEVAS